MTPDESIEALTRQAQAGDRAAFETLIKRYRDRLTHQIEARLGKKVGAYLEVDDVFQDTVGRALQAVGRFRWQGEESFYRWLASIAEHLIWNASQKRCVDELELRINVPGRGSTPSKALRRKERFDRLEKAVSELSPDYRKALTLARLEGLKAHEIAARMNRSPKAVYALLARALEELRETFGDTESLHLPDETFRVEDDSDGD